MREDIIKLAREADEYADKNAPAFTTELDEWQKIRDKHFAALVRADEREACARLAEEWLGPTEDRELHIAAAIRARWNK